MNVPEKRRVQKIDHAVLELLIPVEEREKAKHPFLRRAVLQQFWRDAGDRSERLELGPVFEKIIEGSAIHARS